MSDFLNSLNKDKISNLVIKNMHVIYSNFILNILIKFLKFYYKHLNVLDFVYIYY